MWVVSCRLDRMTSNLDRCWERMRWSRIITQTWSSSRYYIVRNLYCVHTQENKCINYFQGLDLAIEWYEDRVIREKVKTGIRDELLSKKHVQSPERQPQDFINYQPSFISILVKHMHKGVSAEDCMRLVHKYFTKRKLVEWVWWCYLKYRLWHIIVERFCTHLGTLEHRFTI